MFNINEINEPQKGLMDDTLNESFFMPNSNN